MKNLKKLSIRESNIPLGPYDIGPKWTYSSPKTVKASDFEGGYVEYLYLDFYVNNKYIGYLDLTKPEDIVEGEFPFDPMSAIEQGIDDAPNVKISDGIIVYTGGVDVDYSGELYDYSSDYDDYADYDDQEVNYYYTTDYSKATTYTEHELNTLVKDLNAKGYKIRKEDITNSDVYKKFARALGRTVESRTRNRNRLR